MKILEILIMGRLGQLWKWIIIAPIFLGGVLFFSTKLIWMDFEKCTHEADLKLEKDFNLHKEDFRRLLNMSNSDSRIIRIAYDFTWLDNNVSWPRPESELGFSIERWNEYRQLFRVLNLKAGLLREVDKVYFISSACGLVTGGSSKGYVYSEKELTPLLNSLDDTSSFPSKKGYLYKRLNNNWYLYYEID